MEDIKKFEDFLGRMQGLLDNAKKQGHIIVRVEDLENAFPELSESEDERIRKWIIGNIQETLDIGGFLEGQKTMAKNAIAWLEKQSEQNPQGKSALEAAKEEKVDNQNCIKSYAQEHIGDDFEKKELKKIEQSPIDVRTTGYWHVEDVEQKPVWSITDFRTWQYIVSDVLIKKDGIGQYLDSGECKKIAKYMQEEWSKKLSVEWSEEEKDMIEDVIAWLAGCKERDSRDAWKSDLVEDYDKAISWLKSLKDRYTWNFNK